MKFNGKNITELLAVNRRNFIKLLVGGAVGTGISPLPWKLLDDTAIFTQNFPWVPVPPEGEFSHVKSLCNLCRGGCGIEVRKAGDRAVKIEGRVDYPVNPGGACPIGMGGIQLLYNEGNRFTGPMKRLGPRGSGKYEEITWDEALDTLTRRISDLRKQARPEALVAVDGNPPHSTLSVLVERLLQAIGTTNYMRIPTSEDTNQIANLLMQGNNGSTGYDLENADYILSFGCGLLEGWGLPGRVLHAWGLWHSDALKDKVTVVQIESRASNSASKADRWLAARPGTESALALGMANVIIKEGLYNSDFIENSSFGFFDWESPDGRKHKGFRSMVLEKYSPATVEQITGVDKKEIVAVARAFARAGAPIAIYGKDKGTLNGSLYGAMAVQALNAIVGNINRPGGVLVQDPLPLNPLPDIQPDPVASQGLGKPRIDRAGKNPFPFSHSLFANLTAAIEGEGTSPVDTLLVFSSNPAYTLPDGGAFRRALERVPFIVSFSPYRDDTAIMADLILPDHTYLEKTEDIPWPGGLPYPLYGLTRPVVDPVYHTRNSGDVIIQLAKKIGGTVGRSFPWKNYEEILKIRAKGLFDYKPGLTSYDNSIPAWKRLKRSGLLYSDYRSFEEMWENIKSGGFWYRPVYAYKDRERPFPTQSGKFEFFSHRIEQAVKGLDLEKTGVRTAGDEICMPHYEPELSGPGKESPPLRMVPYEMINLSCGRVPTPPYLNKTLFDDQLRKDESFAEINPETAAEYHLKNGDRVIIESHKGKVHVRVNLFEGAMPWTVYLPMGLGHWGDDDFFRGKGSNPNEIVDAGRDPLSGYPVWWSTPVKLTKA